MTAHELGSTVTSRIAAADDALGKAPGHAIALTWCVYAVGVVALLGLPPLGEVGAVGAAQWVAHVALLGALLCIVIVLRGRATDRAAARLDEQTAALADQRAAMQADVARFRALLEAPILNGRRLVPLRVVEGAPGGRRR